MLQLLGKLLRFNFFSFEIASVLVREEISQEVSQQSEHNEPMNEHIKTI